MLGFPTFVCAATAVNSLNANTESLLDMEEERDKTVSTAGTVVFLGLLTMLLEGVIILLRFVTTGAFNAIVVSPCHAINHSHAPHKLPFLEGIMHLTERSTNYLSWRKLCTSQKGVQTTFLGRNYAPHRKEYKLPWEIPSKYFLFC